MERFEFTIGEDVIPFLLGRQCFGEIVDEIIKIGQTQRFDRIFIGCDETVNKLHVPAFAAALKAKGVDFHVCVTKSGEPNKSMASLDYIISDLLKHDCTRNSIVVPFGGGIVGNMFGLASALLFRGIRFIHVPTTFLSAHDSVTSKKQAINHTNLKNIVGTYYVPTAIMVNVSVFETLTQDNIRSGSGELTKNAVMFGGEHLSVLEPILRRHRGNLQYTEEELLQLMRMGIKAKGSLLKDDPKERTTAIIFEYGHTVGHAVELTYGVSHGCAVALGMLAASFMSEKMGLMTPEDREAHDELVKLLDVWLPLPPSQTLQDAVFRRVAGDNKRGYLPLKKGYYPLILAKRIGELHHPNKYYLEYVPEDIVRAAIAYLTTSRYRSHGLVPSAETAAAVPTPAPSAVDSGSRRRAARPVFLSHFASAQMLSSWVASVLFTPPTAQA
eukprot:m.226683 g.226683  ORF g.226683 m.226683 type:complete len:442 (-) comp17012_c0_seq1:149-1474(-)